VINLPLVGASNLSTQVDISEATAIPTAQPIIQDILDVTTVTVTTAIPTAEAMAVNPKSANRLADLEVLRTERVHVSHYTPWTGGPNCARFVNGQCLSKTSSGARWQDWVDKGAACVPEWKFGTRFRLPDGRIFTCVDRGGSIRYGYTPYWMTYDGLGWVDLLTANPGYAYGQIVEVEVHR
jgi:hypothetical protein